MKGSTIECELEADSLSIKIILNWRCLDLFIFICLIKKEQFMCALMCVLFEKKLY